MELFVIGGVLLQGLWLLAFIWKIKVSAVLKSVHKMALYANNVNQDRTDGTEGTRKRNTHKLNQVLMQVFISAQHSTR